jgi:hypothetical protein
MKRTLGPLAAVVLAAACGGKAIRPAEPPPPADKMAEFWVEPTDLASRDLFWGPGGRENAPKADGRWQFLERDNKTWGYSPGFDVKDDKGIEWSVKQGKEAQTEVVASRLMWALGFHQPPTYYVKQWTMSGEKWAGPRDAGRFRPNLPGMKRTGIWDWHENPFTGTAPWRGALVMMAMLNNSDLKPAQNVIYDLAEPREGARRWYVVRDVGQAFGETGMLWPDRNNPDVFEKQGFIEGLREDGTVRFDYTGRHKELFKDLRPEDVRWTAERLSRLSDQQWEDAFRAADYSPEIAQRLIRRMKQKIADGLALKGTAAAQTAR